MSRSSAKRYVFTLNNPDEDFNMEFLRWLDQSPLACYAAWQHEVGDQGTHHIQGLVVLTRRVTLITVKKVLTRAHWEIMRGTIEQAVKYCSKDDTRKPDTEPMSWGTMPTSSQGTRTDLGQIKEKLDAGASEQAIADEHFGSWVRYNRSFREYKRIKTPDRDFKTETTIIVGPTGTGKSSYAQSLPDTYWKQNSQWWDGYTGQDTVVMDDFYGWIKFDEMLRLMDRYPLLVQTKGGQVQFRSHSLILTSNSLPSEWYRKVIESSKSSFPAFCRRVDHWIFMGPNSNKLEAGNWEEFQEMLSQNQVEF